MNSEPDAEATLVNNSVSNSPKKAPRYGFFTKTGTKIGGLATQTYFDLVKFLNQEVPMPPTSNFFSTRKNIQNNQDDDNKSEKSAKTNKKTKEKKELKGFIERSHEILASATTVFPFTLFPDTVVLDRTKLTITKRNFFFSSEVMSIRIEDVLNVSTGIGPFFGSITIASRVLSSEDHFTINFFWRDDAIHLKHVIQGYVIAQHNEYDLKHLERDELIATLKELGHDTGA